MLDIKKCSPETLTRLFAAVSNGQLSSVISLVTDGIGPQTFRNVASTLLHQAVNNGHRDVLQFLLENNAHVDSRVADGTTALMVCAQRGDVEALRLLLAYSADVNAVDFIGRTALYFAAYDGHTDCVNVILSQENLNTSLARKGGWTPLHEAARSGHKEVVDALIYHGFDITPRTDDTGWTPAHLAASAGQVECVDFLLDAGMDVNYVGGAGRCSTMLHEACRKGQNKCISLLLKRGANVLTYDGTYMPHHLTVLHNHPSSLELLLSYWKEKKERTKIIDAFTNVDTDANKAKYNNALHMAAFYDRRECLEVLLRHNAKKVSNGVGRTPETLAVMQLNLECLKLLIAGRKAKEDEANVGFESVSNAHNPLFHLCSNAYKANKNVVRREDKNIACACLLLNSGLVTVTNLCLEAAVQSGSAVLVRQLLLSGADPYKCNVEKGLTKNNKLDFCLDLIEDARSVPRSLLQCSRIKIRELLLNDDQLSMEDVHKLPLPRMLKDYIYHGHYNVKGLCNYL